MNKFFLTVTFSMLLTLTACTSKPASTPAAASPTPNATNTPPAASVSELRATESAEIKTWKSYSSKAGAFSIKYPADYKLMENKTVSADGVYPDVANSTLLVSPATGVKANYALTIKYAKTSKTILEDAKNELSSCSYISENKGANITINNKPGLLYVDSPCGVHNTTEIYILNSGMAYNLSVENTSQYADIKAEVEKVLSTMQFVSNNL